MATLLQLARFSNHVYNDIHQCDRDWELLPSGQLHDSATGFFARAYQHVKTQEIVITHRGTTPVVKDFIRDIELALKQTTPAQIMAAEFARSIYETYRPPKIAVTGHSLGGNNAQAAIVEIKKTAEELGDKPFLSGVIFNSPGIGGYPVGNGPYNVLSINTRGDAINLAGGEHLGSTSITLPTGPAPTLSLGAVLAGSFLNLIPIAISSALWNTTGPAHSIDKIEEYLLYKNPAAGQLEYAPGDGNIHIPEIPIVDPLVSRSGDIITVYGSNQSKAEFKLTGNQFTELNFSSPEENAQVTISGPASASAAFQKKNGEEILELTSGNSYTKITKKDIEIERNKTSINGKIETTSEYADDGTLTETLKEIDTNITTSITTHRTDGSIKYLKYNSIGELIKKIEVAPDGKEQQETYKDNKISETKTITKNKEILTRYSENGKIYFINTTIKTQDNKEITTKYISENGTVTYYETKTTNLNESEHNQNATIELYENGEIKTIHDNENGIQEYYPSSKEVGAMKLKKYIAPENTKQRQLLAQEETATKITTRYLFKIENEHHNHSKEYIYDPSTGQTIEVYKAENSLTTLGSEPRFPALLTVEYPKLGFPENIPTDKIFKNTQQLNPVKFTSDTYYFNKGEKTKTISENEPNSSPKKLSIGENIQPEDIKLSTQLADKALIITNTTSGDQLIIPNYFSRLFSGLPPIISEINYQNNEMTWTTTDILEIANTWRGTNHSDQIITEIGSQIIYAYSGDDFISTGSGDDTIYGGKGNDFITDNSGKNEIIFSRNDGLDTISSHGNTSNPQWQNTIIFTQEISADSVTLKRIAKDQANDDDLMIQIADDSNSIILVNSFFYHADKTLTKTNGFTHLALATPETEGPPSDPLADLDYEIISAIKFHDGTIWNYKEIYERSFMPAKDTLPPSPELHIATAETIEPAAKNDFFIIRENTSTISINHQLDKFSIAPPRILIEKSTGYTQPIPEILQRIYFTDHTIAFDIKENAGQIYRLYQSFFNRAPDPEGIKYWIEKRDNEMDLQSIATIFTNSNEFNENHSKTTNTELVHLLYKNILEREPEQDGLKYWENLLNNRNVDYQTAVILISESKENISKTIEKTGSWIIY